MNIKERLYHHLPIFIQNIAISCFGYFWKKRRFGGVFIQELEKFKERNNYSKEQWNDYLNIELNKMVQHAFRTVPFYQDLYTKNGFASSDFENFKLSDLEKLPILEKADVRAFCKTSLLSNEIDPDGEFFTTSGSTGTPTSIYFSKKFHQKYSAGFEIRGRNFANIHQKMARGMIGGRNVVHSNQTKPPFYRYNFFEKQVYFSIAHLKKENAYNYVDAINKYDIEYMTGYAISNYLLASYIEELGIKVKPLKAVITSSEKLTTEMRDTFRRVYKCETFDGYGSVEACGLITNCEFGSYHVSPDIGIVELLNKNGNPAKPGEIAEIVSTGLLNFDQPLIRYKIGDLAILSQNQNCECGRNLPVIEEIIGRIDDIVTLRDGRQLSSFNRFFANVSGIAEVQVVQVDYEEFHLKIVSDGHFNDNSRNEILEAFKIKLGIVHVEIELVPQIPRGPNGKFKAVISKIGYLNKLNK